MLHLAMWAVLDQLRKKEQRTKAGGGLGNQTKIRKIYSQSKKGFNIKGMN